jgi:hypothetical protein
VGQSWEEQAVEEIATLVRQKAVLLEACERVMSKAKQFYSHQAFHWHADLDADDVDAVRKAVAVGRGELP